jgi:hypothetical protein
MTDPSYFEKVVAHVMRDDDSELGKVKAERDYALHALEREMAICHQAEETNAALVEYIQSSASAGCATARALLRKYKIKGGS